MYVSVCVWIESHLWAGKFDIFQSCEQGNPWWRCILIPFLWFPRNQIWGIMWLSKTPRHIWKENTPVFRLNGFPCFRHVAKKFPNQKRMKSNGQGLMWAKEEIIWVVSHRREVKTREILPGFDSENLNMHEVIGPWEIELCARGLDKSWCYQCHNLFTSRKYAERDCHFVLISVIHDALSLICLSRIVSQIHISHFQNERENHSVALSESHHFRSRGITTVFFVADFLQLSEFVLICIVFKMSRMAVGFRCARKLW